MSYRLSFDILILIHPYLSCNSPYQFVTLFSYEKKNNWSENKVIESIEHLSRTFLCSFLASWKKGCVAYVSKVPKWDMHYEVTSALEVKQ